MAKHTPLRLPAQHPDSATLIRFADALNTRLREIEAAHSQVQGLINQVIKANNLSK